MVGREEANTKFTFVSSASSYTCILIKEAVFSKKSFGEKSPFVPTQSLFK